jgi:ribosome-interacting GTPase 1
MSYKLEIKREKDFLSAIVTGIRTSESIKNATREICENCIKNKYTKALVDVRDFKEHISTMNSFDLASVELPDIIRRSIKKVAILDLEEFEVDKKFFESVARYWGHNVRIFTDINDAKQWLS